MTHYTSIGGRYITFVFIISDVGKCSVWTLKISFPKVGATRKFLNFLFVK